MATLRRIDLIVDRPDGDATKRLRCARLRCLMSAKSGLVLMLLLNVRTEATPPYGATDCRSQPGPKLPVIVQRDFGSKNLGQVMSCTSLVAMPVQSFQAMM